MLLPRLGCFENAVKILQYRFQVAVKAAEVAEKQRICEEELAKAEPALQV